MSLRKLRVIVLAMSFRRILALVVALASAGLAVACGSRTGLLLPSEEQPEDAGEEDALSPIDVTPPPPEAPNPCPDGGPTLVYVITEQNTLMSFDPPTGTFTRIGTLACPSASLPFSMAVDREGIAYVVFYDGELFRVSTATASCEPTGFVMEQAGFPTRFGMGFSRDTNGMTETLFVSGDPSDDAGDIGPAVLGAVNTTTFQLTNIGPFVPSIYEPELTGTGAGDLFAFFTPNPEDTSNTAIGQIDKVTGAVIAESPLPGVALGQGWAFGFWGGDFYVFTGTGPAGSSIVTRYRPSDGSIVQVASTDETIVGAGVSTCAPAR